MSASTQHTPMRQKPGISRGLQRVILFGFGFYGASAAAIVLWRWF